MACEATSGTFYMGKIGEGAMEKIRKGALKKIRLQLSVGATEKNCGGWCLSILL